MDIISQLAVWAIPVIVAVTFHEAAHGYVAWRLGDDTAKRLGRVTFNPFRHIDPMGTVLLPLALILMRAPFLFGYAKPVPVNFARLRKPRQHMVAVAAAGPMTNLGLAVISAMLVHVAVWLPTSVVGWAVAMLDSSIKLNLVLALFNMLPLPPLDGGRVAVGLLPNSLAIPLARLERHGFFILIGVIFILPMLGRLIGVNLAVFETLVLVPAGFLYNLILILTGLS